MSLNSAMWIFNGENSKFPSGVFSSLANGIEYIKKYNLSGTITEYPIDMGCYDWAVSLGYFVPNGYVFPLLALLMAVANVSGSIAGTCLALKHGSAFVRQIFLRLVGVLIVKFAWDTWAIFY